MLTSKISMLLLEWLLPYSYFHGYDNCFEMNSSIVFINLLQFFELKYVCVNGNALSDILCLFCRRTPTTVMVRETHVERMGSIQDIAYEILNVLEFNRSALFIFF
jgi:hypothetical protein